MAWKVVGFLHPRATSKDTPKKMQYGPLPAKRWYPAKGEKKPRMPKAKTGGNRGIFDKAEQGRKAVEYALWLAKRDGIELPGGSPVACWAGVTLPTGKYQPRVSCVTFGNSLPRVRIDIPNWDWIPAEPVMGINEDYFRDLLVMPVAHEMAEMEAA